jgi:putative oxidoreductase
MLYYSKTRLGADLGLFALRLVAGVALAWHGVLKFQSEGGWTLWMGSEDVYPSWAQAVAAVCETAGGAGILLGLLTPLASLAVLAVMGGALNMHVARGDPFVAKESSWEYPCLLAATGLLLLLAGPGRLSIDALVSRRKANRTNTNPGPTPSPSD